MSSKKLLIKLLLGNVPLVNILGSIDDKIENNERIIERIKNLMQNIFINFEESINNPIVQKMEDYVTFIKGKKPLNTNKNLKSYLTIEGMTQNKFEKVCSDQMIFAESQDILMVMDGASSGDIYSGYCGVVGSTLAKLNIKSKKVIPLIEQKLIFMNKKIKELNTGSAIPHANKKYIRSIQIKLSNDQLQTKIINQLQDLKKAINKTNQQNIRLNQLKQLYLKQFFI